VGESGQPGLALVDVVAMFHFQTLDVYKCAVAFLPDAYRLAKEGDAEMASQLRRAALSINLNIAEGTGRFGNDERRFLVIARGSAFPAILDALRAIGVVDSGMNASSSLLHRIVSMLTKMIQSPTPTPTPTPTPKR
jgi:four helix bundle protein